MKLQPAQRVAMQIIQALHHGCVEIKAAGSIRREILKVKDVELVYISKTSSMQMDLFGSQVQTFFHIDTILATLIDDGTLIKDTTVKQWGSKYKRVVHCTSGVVIELFRAETDNWGYILALRTGPADFNKVLVTKRAHGGALPPRLELRDGYVWHKGKSLPVPTELAFFTALDLPLLPPQQRTAERLRHYIQEKHLKRHIQERQDR